MTELLRRLAQLLGYAIAPLLISGCDSKALGDTLPPHRFKLTAYVDTPEGLKTGSSVMEVQWSMPGKVWGTQGTAGYTLKAQAVVVDLPRKQTLFILLRSRWNPDWAADAGYPPNIMLRDAPATISEFAIGRWRQRQMGDREPISNYPYFARFGDPSDPKTIAEVDPDNLDESFGPGIRLNKLTVQTSDAPITTGIKRRLPWLDDPSTGFFRSERDSRGYVVPTKTRTIAHEVRYLDFFRKF